MSSELFVFDNTFFSDPFSPSLLDQHHDNIFQENDFVITNSLIQETPLDDDQIASVLLSSSPPSYQLENLSLCQTNPYVGFADYSVKTEEIQVHLHSDFSVMVPQSCVTQENAHVKLMQRSFSSNSFENKPSFSIYTPHFVTLTESPNLQTPPLTSPENSFSSGQMRRVCSTGDLQKMKTRNSLSLSPLSGFMEEANIKVGRYSAEERKERIHRYRAKRNQRNFNKTIKYACRKTLADNRPRIRGRFARNDEAGEIPRTTMFNRYEDDDDLWIEGVHEEEQEGSVGRGVLPLYHSYGSMTQYRGF